MSPVFRSGSVPGCSRMPSPVTATPGMPSAPTTPAIVRQLMQPNDARPTRFAWLAICLGSFLLPACSMLSPGQGAALPSLPSPLQLRTTQEPASTALADPHFTYCVAAGGCSRPTLLTPVPSAPPSTPAHSPVASQTVVAPALSPAAAASQLNVSFAFLKSSIDATQRAAIAQWVQQQRDADWNHYRLLVHFTHQGQSSLRLAEARAKAVIALFNSLGLQGIPVTNLSDGLPHRVVGITHLATAPAASAPFALSPQSASTSPTASAAGAVPRGETKPH